MNTKKGRLAAGIVFTAAAVICFLLFFRSCTDGMPAVQTDTGNTGTAAGTVTDTAAKTIAAQTAVSEALRTQVPSAEPVYENAVDFEELTAQNEDVYAWLEVTGSTVNYPIVQSAEDDTYYLTHDINGKHDAKGMIYSEHRYNGTDFSDPVTILYGHRRNDMTMFSSLQPLYSDRAYFDEHREITVYLPEKELHYRIIAAVPYDDRHILYEYDFTKAKDFAAFFDSVFEMRSLDANVDTEAYPDYDDRILILSTCLWGDKSQRYLVISVLQTEN